MSEPGIGRNAGGDKGATKRRTCPYCAERIRPCNMARHLAVHRRELRFLTEDEQDARRAMGDHTTHVPR